MLIEFDGNANHIDPKTNLFEQKILDEFISGQINLSDILKKYDIKSITQYNIPESEEIEIMQKLYDTDANITHSTTKLIKRFYDASNMCITEIIKSDSYKLYYFYSNDNKYIVLFSENKIKYIKHIIDSAINYSIKIYNIEELNICNKHKKFLFLLKHNFSPFKQIECYDIIEWNA